MMERCRRYRTGSHLSRAVVWLLLAATPVLIGQGCPFFGGSGIEPVTLPGLITGATAPTGNVSPTLQFVTPAEDVRGEVGDIITLSWTDNDPDNNASITLLIDPDGTPNNGNEVLLTVTSEDGDGTADTFGLDTAAVGLVPGTYRIIAMISDGVNAEAAVVAPGRIILYAQGVIPGNVSPSIEVTQPTQNVGVSQGEVVTVSYCGADRDDGEGGVTPDVIILFDYDNNPLNDLDLNATNADLMLADLCAGTLPATLTGVHAGAIIVGCAQDDDCANTGAATNFPVTVDVTAIPPLPSGDPYYIRATMWDHTNPPVHDYAISTVTVSALGSGVVDLGNVGRGISGTKFYGFDAGGETGYTGLDLGDLDGDGADDFVIVDRLGRPYEEGNIGFARIVFGMPGQKFGNEIPVNSISTSTRGIQLPMYGHARTGTWYVGDSTVPGLTGTDGIISVARLGDVTGDGRPEILFGLPYVRQFFDYHDDDPCDCKCPGDDPKPEDFNCYNDGLPNPYSAEEKCTGWEYDIISGFDSREDLSGIADCSNDGSPNWESIDGGYAVMVGSSLNAAGDLNILNYPMVGLNFVGQRTEGTGSEVQYAGARWRGPWYDFSGYEGGYFFGSGSGGISSFSRFGETVSSMPRMTNTDQTISPRYGPNVLISAPQGAGGRGIVYYFPGQNFATFGGENSSSLPIYSSCRGKCKEGISRGLLWPGHSTIVGAEVGDELGYAGPAGDYNLDGNRDIFFGAPGADRDGATDNGIVYILFGRRDFSGFDLADPDTNPPRVEIRGTSPGDRFGAMQTILGDVDQDGMTDLGFASQFSDGPGGQDAGFVGIIFGGRLTTGENIFSVSQLATAQLPGTQIYGTQSGGHAGAVINNAGDFNADGIDDLLIVAPEETRTIDGQIRRGVAYLVFGGAHLRNGVFDLGQIGSSQLPGAVFVSPYEVNTADEATIDWAGAAGDVDNDGFDDILIGVSRADFVNPLEPSMRRPDAGEMYLVYGNNTGSNTLGQ